MRLVLFLGAGFSAAWHLPVMNSFFEVAKNHQKVLLDDKIFLAALQQQAKDGHGTLGGRLADMEHVLSYALMRKGAERVPPKGGEITLRRVQRIISTVYKGVKSQHYGLHREAFKRLLGVPSRGWNHDFTIITTNYDLLPEIMLKPIGFNIGLANNWKPLSSDRGNSFYGNGLAGLNCTICKLHGAVNWFENPNPEESAKLLVADKQVARMRMNFSEDDPDTDVEAVNVLLPEVCSEDFGQSTDGVPYPVIVPPTLFKMQNELAFDDVWRVAAEAIERAERIMFIGYSFPPSDTHMKYFLGTHLAVNNYNPRIEIVDRDVSGVVEKLKTNQTFGDLFFENLIQTKGKWEETSTRLIDLD